MLLNFIFEVLSCPRGDGCGLVHLTYGGTCKNGEVTLSAYLQDNGVFAGGKIVVQGEDKNCPVKPGPSDCKENYVLTKSGYEFKNSMNFTYNKWGILSNVNLLVAN